jgi:hypothetical protein
MKKQPRLCRIAWLDIFGDKIDWQLRGTHLQVTGLKEKEEKKKYSAQDDSGKLHVNASCLAFHVEVR